MPKLLKFELKFSEITQIDLEIINLFLFEKGINGLEEDLKEGRFFLYIEDGDTAILDELKNFCAIKNIKLESIEEVNFYRNYLLKWRRYFSLSIVENVIIKPSWKKYHIIEIDPKSSFGTGKHPTTRICIKLLKFYIENVKKPSSFLDAGSGSGILSIVAKKFGIKEVVAFDIDFDAVKVSVENFKRNRLKRVKIFCGSFSGIKRGIKFDVVCANLLSSTILAHQKEIKELTGKNGAVIISGIEENEKKDFFCRFDFKSFKKLKTVKEKNWLGFIALKVS